MRDYNAEAIDNEHRKYAYDFDQSLREYMIRQFAPFLRGGRALELGCYKGDFTSLLLGHFSDVTVIEASGDLIEIARNRLPSTVRFIHATFEEAKLDDAFDAVFLIHTLEHLDDPTCVLRRIKDWLKSTGLLIVAVPNANAVSRQIAVKMGIISHHCEVTEAERLHGHRITYSLDTLERDIRLAGLNIVSRGGVFFKPLANFQFDALRKTGAIDEAYFEGCFQLGMHYPDLCASIYAVCTI